MMIKNLILFIAFNFGALALGGLATGDGVPSEWYQTLNKAPWTPPGWVFGAAWTTIMSCFAIYMAILLDRKQKPHQQIFILFGIQWLLNVGWNPIFFSLHQVGVALFVIAMLTLLVAFILIHFRSVQKLASLLLLPYFIWLLIATSLNAYILIYN